MLEEEKRLEEVRYNNAKNIYNAYKELGLNPYDSAIGKSLIPKLEQEEIVRTKLNTDYENAKKVYYTYKKLGLDPSTSAIDKNLISILEKEENAKKTIDMNYEDASKEIDNKYNLNDIKYQQKLKVFSMKKSIDKEPIAFNKKVKTLLKQDLATRICVFMVIGGLVTTEIISLANGYKKGKERNDYLKEYKTEIFNENSNKWATKSREYDEKTEESYVKLTINHSHNINNMLLETKENYNDPIIAFYLFYFSLDEWCLNNKLTEYLNNFNKIYETDYTSLEDFLTKNNFKNLKDLKKYVSDVIESEKELNGNRNSNAGR